VFAVNGCKNNEIKELVVGVSPDYPPFAFEYRNELIGFDIDLIRAISERLNYNLVLKKMDFDELLPALENKTIDLVASSVTKTVDRSEKFEFSHPYYKPSFALVFKKEKLKKIHTISDVDGVIGVEKATTMEEYLDNFVKDVGIQESEKKEIIEKKSDNLITKIYFSSKEIFINDKIEEIENLVDDEQREAHDKKNNFEIKLYDKHTSLANALQKDEISAMLVEVLQAEVIVQNDRNLSYIPIDYQQNNNSSYCIVFQKNSKLVDKFNKVLDDIDSEGKIDILKLRWFSGYGIFNNILRN
jgi:ABC-type amino acid transport substrate-binding protein